MSITEINIQNQQKTDSLWLTKVRLFIIFIFLPALAPVVECKNIITTVNEALSREEKENLRILFHNLFAESELGYTLFGDKPMSFCFPPISIVRIATKDCFFKIYFSGSIPLNAINALKKIAEIWQNENYILLINERKGLPYSIFLINKEKFNCVFNENTDVFINKYGPQITAESFLKDLKDKKIDLTKLLQEEHMIIGILLGYGRHNAELFERRHILLMEKTSVPYSIIQKPRNPFCSIEEELYYLNNHLKSINTLESQLLLVTPVNFVGDLEYLETPHLQEQYKFMHKELTQLFLREDWFSFILERLFSHSK